MIIILIKYVLIDTFLPNKNFDFENFIYINYPLYLCKNIFIIFIINIIIYNTKIININFRSFLAIIFVYVIIMLRVLMFDQLFYSRTIPFIEGKEENERNREISK